MKKDLGVHPFLFPMPVLMIATYGDNDKVDVMNMVWGGICDANKVALNITESHKTSENIKKRGAFTISVADVEHLEESDFFGTASGNKMEDKFERTISSKMKLVKAADKKAYGYVPQNTYLAEEPVQFKEVQTAHNIVKSDKF